MSALVSKLVYRLDRLSAVLNVWCWIAANSFLLVMIAAVALQVVARYLFFSPPSWTEELARYCMIWAGYLGATVAFYRHEDPVLVTRQLADVNFLSTFFIWVKYFAVLVFVLPIVYWSPVILSYHMIRETESMRLTSAYVMLIVPIFSLVIVVHVFSRLLSTMERT